PGIGPKTAAELINTYGDLETLLARSAEIKQPKRREAVETHAEQARLSKRLITLHEDVPVPMALEALALRAPAPEKILAFAQAHGFKTLVTRLQAKMPSLRGSEATAAIQTPAAGWIASSPAAPRNDASYILLRDEPTLSAWIARAK